MKYISKMQGLALLIGSVLIAGCDEDDSKDTTSTIDSAGGETNYVASQYGSPVLCPEGMSWATEAEVFQVVNDFGFLDDGGTVEIPRGCYQLNTELTLSGRKNITIKGAGIDKTFLDFSQSSTGEGISVINSENVIISDLQVSEAAKNAIKVTDTDGLIIRDVAAIWMDVPRIPEPEIDPNTGDVKLDGSGKPVYSLRGTYALYPVSSSNVLIENTWSYGSADAGVYVGQSENVVVRNNVAEKNIAGIEIENTKNADVYNNLALGNTGGLLVFDLPGAAQGNPGDPLSGNITGNVRLFNNIVRDNNLANYVREACKPNCGFAGGVHIVPPGTGVIVLAARDTEIFNNTIINHDSAAATITSYLVAEDNTDKYIPGNGQEGDAIFFGWNPVPTDIYMHDNQIENIGANPNGDLITEMILGYSAAHGDFPNVLYDGIGEVIVRTGEFVAANLEQSVGFKPIADGLENAVVGTPLEGQGFWDYLWHWQADSICVQNNSTPLTVGSLYDGQDINSFMADDAGYLANPAFLYGSQGDVLSCTGTKQLGGTATIGDVTYGYNL